MFPNFWQNRTVAVPPRTLNMLAKQQFELAKNPPADIVFYQNEEGDLFDIQADVIGPGKSFG